MSDEAVRQHYKYATGKGITPPPAKSPGTPSEGKAPSKDSGKTPA